MATESFGVTWFQIKGSGDIIYYDNKFAREIIDNTVQLDRTECGLDRHFVRENFERNIVSIPFVNSYEQFAEVLTHVVCSKVFNDSLVKLCMYDLYALT